MPLYDRRMQKTTNLSLDRLSYSTWKNLWGLNISPKTSIWLKQETRRCLCAPGWLFKQIIVCFFSYTSLVSEQSIRIPLKFLISFRLKLACMDKLLRNMETASSLAFTEAEMTKSFLRMTTMISDHTKLPPSRVSKSCSIWTRQLLTQRMTYCLLLASIWAHITSWRAPSLGRASWVTFGLMSQ